MLRTLWVAVVAALATLFYAPLVILVSALRSNAAPVIDRMIRRWARLIVNAAGIRLRVENTERLQDDKRYILTANHCSYLDIPCLFVGIPQPLRFLAKESLFKIPIFGWGLSAAGFVPIDRKNRRTAVKSFDLAVKRIRRGNSLVIFPEEGRSRERAMRPFQRGAFLLALKSELPVVPVGLIGTFDVLPPKRWSLKPGEVVIRVGEPIDSSAYTLKQKEELTQRARAAVVELLRGTPNEQPVS